MLFFILFIRDAIADRDVRDTQYLTFILYSVCQSLEIVTNVKLSTLQINNITLEQEAYYISFLLLSNIVK